MRDNFLISVSTDPLNGSSSEMYVSYAKEALNSGADFLHCDIMDGKFVNKKTIDYKIVGEINDNSLIPLDVHLMVEKPWLYINEYAKAGANILTVHYEAFKSKVKLVKTLKKIRKKNILAGLSLKLETDVKNIKKLTNYFDLILLMSVNPGMSGQNFQKQIFEKIKELKFYLKKDILIEVDGGINPNYITKLKELGVNIIVSGSYYYNSKNKINAINFLKN